MTGVYARKRWRGCRLENEEISSRWAYGHVRKDLSSDGKSLDGCLVCRQARNSICDLWGES